MRILIVSQYFWPEHSPINDLAQALAARGHRVDVLTGMPNATGRFAPGYGGWRPRRDAWNGITIHRLPIVPRGSRIRLQLPLNYLSFWLSGWLLGPRLVPDDIDVIFVWLPSPVTAALPAIRLKARLRRPLVLWVQDLWPESVGAAGGIGSPWVLRAVGRLVRHIYRHADRILMESPAFADSIVAHGGDPQRLDYVPNWAEADYRPLPRQRGAAEDAELPAGFRLLYTGTIGEAHDFPTLLAAAERLRHRPEIQWIVFGDGRNRWKVEEEIARRGLGACFHLMGWRPPAAIPGYIAHADALIVSLKDEPLFALTIPSKLQAYLACGRPLIGSINGVVARLIAEAGAGLCAPAGTPAALAAQVEALAALPAAERDAMGARARAYSEQHFAREHIIDRIEDALRGVG